MIDQTPEGGVEIPWPGIAPASTGGAFMPSPIIKPYGDFIQLDYQKPTMAGGLHLPSSAKTPELITVTVLAAGPDVKMAKPGTKVIILTQAFMGGANGSTLEGKKVYFTKESHIVGVLDAPETH